jgi:hypothetical protein
MQLVNQKFHYIVDSHLNVVHKMTYSTFTLTKKVFTLVPFDTRTRTTISLSPSFQPELYPATLNEKFSFANKLMVMFIPNLHGM